MKQKVDCYFASGSSSSSSALGCDLIPNHPLIFPHEARTATPIPSNAAISNWIKKLPEPGSRYGRGVKCMSSPIQQLQGQHLPVGRSPDNSYTGLCADPQRRAGRRILDTAV